MCTQIHGAYTHAKVHVDSKEVKCAYANSRSRHADQSARRMKEIGYVYVDSRWGVAKKGAGGCSCVRHSVAAEMLSTAQSTYSELSTAQSTYSETAEMIHNDS